MPSAIVVEGNTDYAIVKALDSTLPVAKPERAAGRDAAIRRAALAARQVGSHHIVLLLDWNGHTQEALQEEVRAILEAEWGTPPIQNAGRYIHAKSSVRLVPAGLPQDPV